MGIGRREARDLNRAERDREHRCNAGKSGGCVTISAAFAAIAGPRFSTSGSSFERLLAVDNSKKLARRAQEENPCGFVVMKGFFLLAKNPVFDICKWNSLPSCRIASLSAMSFFTCRSSAPVAKGNLPS
jgi:hypothetical protein